ncbi:MAG: succinate dehydrogenase, hydrophobic membrane anchor protein [Gammaproteobacteria bacterium]|jgi:succinate dehydrogenase / fumarate reductase, membrane anchor subunit
MRLRTPLAQARGLGAARDGIHHWWTQRLTALALIPLSLWLVASIITITGADYATAVEWVQSPVVAVLLLLFIAVAFYHAQLGMQVVLEDYVHGGWAKVATIILSKFLMIALAFVAGFAVLRVALGG